MTTTTMTLEQVITVVKELPPALQQEVGDFALFLQQKRLKDRTSAPTFEWMGALKELQEQYTSVELPHEAVEWRSESLLKTTA